MEGFNVKKEIYRNSRQTIGNQSEGCNYQTEMALSDSVPVMLHTQKQNLMSSEQHTFTDIIYTRIGEEGADQHTGKCVCTGSV